MTEAKRTQFFTLTSSQVIEKLCWGLAGLALELGASAGSAAPSAAALAAGLSGGNCLYVSAGGLAGALLHGLEAGLIGVCGLAIVLLARLIPDLHNVKIRAALRFFAAAMGCFFPRSAQVTEPSQLLQAVISALGAGVFACCICLLSESVRLRGFDISEQRQFTEAAVIAAFVFMSLGALDYPALNIGRTALGVLLLAVTYRKKLAWCAVGLAALFGLCVSGVGAGAAAIALAALLSASLTRFGRITQSIGFVFFCCTAVLVGGIDEGGWRIPLEAAAAGALYAAIPQKLFVREETGFADERVGMLIRDRLCFAAEAIAGVGSGLSAAAETLDSKYGMTRERIAEYAAEKSCRSCPKSMQCWGQMYSVFTAETERLVELVRGGVQLSEGALSAECAAQCCNPSGFVRAVSDAYARYAAAAQDEQRVRELRRIYTDQLEGIRDILREMAAGLNGKTAETNQPAQRRTEEVLKNSGMDNPRVFISLDRRGRLLFEAYGDSEPKVAADYLGQLLITALGREMELPTISVSGGRYRVTTREQCKLSAQVGAFQLCRGKNRVCGDCYDTFTDPQGAMYVVLSDGMGTGSRARIDSAMVCSVMSRLLKAGLSLSSALETANNALMVKSADESFATLDILRIDLADGECAVYKAGASTTYIKSGERLMRAVLSSPPVGTGGRLSVPVQRFSVSAGDIIIMATDGAELDEEWLARELSVPSEPEELSERIAKAARAAENGQLDDISVVAVAVGR